MPKAFDTVIKCLAKSPVQLMLIVLASIVIYSNTFGVPFLFDDEASIQLNSAMHGLANYFAGGAGYRFLPNRALGYLSFALNYEFGGLNVAGYHLVNLAIHCVNGLLVYALVASLLRTPCFTAGEEVPPAPRPATAWLPLVVALFFVCHPIQTQAVTYIVQRLTSLATLFYLASVTCYLRWRLARAAGTPFGSLKALPFYLLCLAAALCAMKTKEIAFTLPFAVLLCELIFFGRPSLARLAALVPLALTAAIIPVTTYGTSLTRTGGILSDVSSAATVASPLSRWEYLCTQFSAIVSYLRLLVILVGQSLDHSYPVNHSLFEAPALLGCLALCALFAAGLWFWRAGTACRNSGLLQPTCAAERGCYRLAAFGILWFFTAISIESSIIPISDVMVEHRVYLPSFGFFLALSALGAVWVARLGGRRGWVPRLAGALLALTIALYSGATYARNQVWGDWLSIWQDTVQKNPDNPRAHNILGIGFLYRHLFEAAVPQFQKAAELDPVYLEAYFNLGLAFRQMERHQDSLEMYRKALNLNGSNSVQAAKIYSELGVNHTLLGDLDHAIEDFGNAVRCDPEFVEYRNNLAHAMLDKGLVDGAVAEFGNALKIDPSNQRAKEMLQEIAAFKAHGSKRP